MVLKIFHNSSTYVYKDIDETFCVTKSYGGMLSLQFDVNINHPLYPYLREETRLEYDGQYYLIKGVNERTSAKICTINAELDLTGLENKIYGSKTWTTESFANFSRDILSGTGWTMVNADLVSRRTTTEAQDQTPRQLLEHSTNSTSYGTCYEYDTMNRRITCIKPENNTSPTGCYFTDELNLSELTFKGSSSGLVTKLYPIGKDGLTIKSVNNGKDYIENYSYTSKVVCQIWRDERYTNAQSLCDDAVVKLAALAKPERSYTCKVIDLAKTNPEVYGTILRFKLYDVITLVDRIRNSRIDHRIVEIKEYPANHALDTVTLSSIAGRVTGKITELNSRVTELDAQRLHDRTKINEIKQDLDSTVLHVAESWAESENSSTISQTAEGLFFDVSKIIGVGQWSTKIQQSANDIRIAWNSNSDYIKFELDTETLKPALNIYNLNDDKLMSLDYRGQSFFYNNSRIGKMGTNSLKGDSSYRGIVFDLDSTGQYMCWAAKEDKSDDFYDLKLLFLNKSFTVGSGDNRVTYRPGLHLMDNTFANGNLYLDSTHRVVRVANNGLEDGVAYAGKFSFSRAVTDASTHQTSYKHYVQFEGSKFTVYNNTSVNYYANISMNGFSILGQSDVRLKQSLAPTQISALDIINAVDMYEFNWIKDNAFVPLGIMAQQLQAVAPQLVESDEDGVLQIKTTDLIYYLFKAVQELSVGNYTKVPFNENDYIKFKQTDLAATGSGTSESSEYDSVKIEINNDSEGEE